MNNRAIQYAKLYKQWRGKETVFGNFLMSRALSKILQRHKLTSLELDVIVNEIRKYEKRYGGMFLAFRRGM